jgi:hypothetical protein
MRVRRPFLLALLVSIMLHLGVAIGPGWHLSLLDSADDAPLDILDARLAPKRAEPPEPTIRTVRRKRIVAAPTPAGPPIPQLEESRSEPQAARVDAPASPELADIPVAVAPRVLALPHRVDISYSVSMGTSGFVIGRSVHELRHDNRTYRLRSTTETTGLAGLFKPIKLVHLSEGEIDAAGLRPLQFRIERDGVADERASFDWSAGEVSLPVREKVFPLEPGAQDMLSMFCQLALIPTDGPKVMMPVVTGKKIERYEFEVMGEELVSTGLGEIRATHLRTRAATGTEATEVWLGLSVSRLPVRIRHTDRKGEVFDQVADRIQLGTETGDAH